MRVFGDLVSSDYRVFRVQSMAAGLILIRRMTLFRTSWRCACGQRISSASNRRDSIGRSPWFYLRRRCVLHSLISLMFLHRNSCQLAQCCDLLWDHCRVADFAVSSNQHRGVRRDICAGIQVAYLTIQLQQNSSAVAAAPDLRRSISLFIYSVAQPQSPDAPPLNL